MSGSQTRSSSLAWELGDTRVVQLLIEIRSSADSCEIVLSWILSEMNDLDTQLEGVHETRSPAGNMTLFSGATPFPAYFRRAENAGMYVSVE